VIRRIPLLLAFLPVLVLAAAPAQASQGIVPGSYNVTPSTTQAGGHPNIEMSFALEDPGAPEAARDVSVNTPEGIFGNPGAIVHCNAVDFALTRCPSSSQAGLIEIRANYEGDPENLLGTVPIYNREPLGDQTALFGFVNPTLQIPVQIPVAVRTASDFGLRFTVAGLTQLAPLKSAKLIYWGFPADSVHDGERFPKGSPGDPAGCPDVTAAEVSGSGCLNGMTTKAGIFVQPLIDNPSICTGAPLAISIDVVTYQDPDNPSHDEAAYPESTGCPNVTFKPTLLATPTTTEADSAAGLDLRMRAFQAFGKAPTNSPIRSASLTLPEGLTINPDAADGQSACLDTDVNFGSENAAHCPDGSKIGTFAVGSPALEGPLTGAVYIGQPKQGDQYRLFLIADGFGIHAKFLASFHPDLETGQVTALIDNLPEVPFDDFELHLFASDRGLMATPTHCTLYPVSARFFPWNDKLADVTSTQFFPIDSGPGGAGCPGPTRSFRPRLTAGTTNANAGAYSNFALHLDRDDGDQFLRDVNFKLPPGFTGNLRGVSYCPENLIAAASTRSGLAEQAAPSCPASSQIGTTDVAAGPGSHPFHAVGKMYFAGPLNGAPLSLVVVTPALAGPYDYGTIVVRVALRVNPLTAQVSALSDTIPRIVGGVPIRLRSIGVDINRVGFAINPTNCSVFSVASQGIGDQGSITDFSSYFHAVNCRSLPFHPQMSVRQLGGRKDTRRSRNPRLRFDLHTRPGDANINSMSVTLPTAYEIDQSHLGNICSEAELAGSRCASRQPVGEASTTTPLLDRPLTGLVYAVSGSGGLPKLAFLLDGQVNLVPRAVTVTDSKGRLRTTVPVVPDAPIGHFQLTLLGGRQGYLVHTRSVCGHRPVVEISYAAQNGRTFAQKARLKAPACPKASPSKRRTASATRRNES
jgi:hypothetical protein